MDARTVLIALHEMEGVGWKTIRLLADRLPDLSELPGRTAKAIAGLGVQAARAETIARQLSPDWIRPKLEAYERAGVSVHTVFDGTYPRLLKQSAMRPWVLYGKGRLPPDVPLPLAVVGTRNPTVYGLKAAESIARELSDMGFCIVSGLARGVDSAAHRGALQGRGGTIAVMAGGLDAVYPPENERLFAAIAENGLLLSEQPFGTKLSPGLFPQRNRIIAGLSLGTFVVEAAERSGALITADLALEESRDVFALPGSIYSPKSAGCHALLKQGAALAAGAGDIAAEYAHLPAFRASAATTGSRPAAVSAEPMPSAEAERPDNERGCRTDRHRGGQKHSPAAELTPEERRIYSLLSGEPVTFDQLLERSQTTFGHLHAILLSLTMKQKIASLPGPSYIVISS